MKQQNITFIGAGNMSEALISGLVKAGHPVDNITVTDTQSSRLEALVEAYGINTSSNNIDAIENANAFASSSTGLFIVRVIT